jgi:hypothetical protein
VTTAAFDPVAIAGSLASGAAFERGLILRIMGDTLPLYPPWS